jgi:hypothetical protein
LAGATLDVLGLETDWGEVGGYSHAWKLRLVAAHLEGVDPRQVVLFVDAYDVLLNSGGADVVAAFATRFTRKIVFASEVDCW